MDRGTGERLGQANGSKLQSADAQNTNAHKEAILNKYPSARN